MGTGSALTRDRRGNGKGKIRSGGVLGALPGEAGDTREPIGQSHVTGFCTCVAVDRAIAREAMQCLNASKVKGRSVKVRRVGTA